MFTPLTRMRCRHRASDLFGGNIGVIDGDRQFTYGEFGARCQRLASGLRQRGIEPGDRVAVLSFNNHQLLECYYGVIQAGAIVMPLNVRLSPPELGGILKHAGARMLVYHDLFQPLVDALRPACPEIESFVPLSSDYEEIINSGTAERADISKVDENSIAELFYTSGSTGTPKGVALSHRTLYLHSLAVMTLYVSVDTMSYLHTIPFFHANGWGGPHALTYRGVKQVMVGKFEPTLVFDQIQKHGCTDMYLVPAMANALLASPDREKYEMFSLRRIFMGGAASSPTLIERMEKVFGCDCFSGYGLTETSPVVAGALPKPGLEYESEQERIRRQAMTGWPLVGNEMRVVDAEDHPVPKDGKTIGEIVVRGDHVMDGYYKEPEQTATAVVDGWLHTGDMAVWDETGYFHIVDRKKEIIISGGENISSLEIERTIAAHPAVFESAVVAAPDDKWGEVPAAIVVTKSGATLTADELLEFLSGKLARFKLPKIVEIRTEQLPKGGTGKIKKMDLKEAFWKGKDTRVQG
ncbi:MAG: long-chain-fatty-acid--CoA ligase [bacterium]|nr:long-chain-fatty-acid--CoA ligase [bacterium]